jgi:hypothetical protein
VERPSQLAQVNTVSQALTELTASLHASRLELENLAAHFLSAWKEAEVLGNAIDLSEILQWLIQANIRMRRIIISPLMVQTGWILFELALSRITGLSYTTERGYFEWNCGADSGLHPEPLDSASFRRLLERVISTHPTTFEDFEELLA